MKDYHCKACPRWLFRSDATYGREVILCPGCKTMQTIYLGGYQRTTAEEKLQTAKK